MGALLGAAADGVGASIEDLAVKPSLGVGCVDEICYEAVEDVGKEGGKVEKLGRGGEMHTGWWKA